MTKKQKLELTWIDKEARSKLGPRVSCVKTSIRKDKVIMNQWAKREEQIERVMGATVGMYGELQRIAGKSLQEIEGLSLQPLEAPVANNRDAVE